MFESGNLRECIIIPWQICKICDFYPNTPYMYRFASCFYSLILLRIKQLVLNISGFRGATTDNVRRRRAIFAAFLTAREKNVLLRHTLSGVDRIDRGDSPFSSWKQILARCFISIYYLDKSPCKKEYNRTKICQPVALNFICSSILSTFVNAPYYRQLVDIHILVCCQHYQPPNVCYL